MIAELGLTEAEISVAARSWGVSQLRAIQRIASQARRSYRLGSRVPRDSQVISRFGAAIGIYTAGRVGYAMGRHRVTDQLRGRAPKPREIPNPDEIDTNKYRAGNPNTFNTEGLQKQLFPMKTIATSGDMVPLGPAGRLCSNKTVSKGLVGNRKRSLMQLFQRYISQIYRFQGVTDFMKLSNTVYGAYLLDHRQTTLDVGTAPPVPTLGAGVDLPVYIINLTQPGHAYNSIIDQTTGAVSTVNTFACPIHRLVKRTTPIVGPSVPSGYKNYIWKNMPEVNGGPLGTSSVFYSQLEDSNGFPDDKTRAVHDWTSLDLCFYSPSQRVCKIHLFEVSFPASHVGPYRTYVNLTDTATLNYFDDSTPSLDEASSSDEFWDRFLAKKLAGPLMILKKQDNDERRMRIHSHEVMCLTSKLTTDSNPNPMTCHKKIFYPGGRAHNYVKPGPVENSANNYVPSGTSVSGTQKFGYDNVNSELIPIPCELDQARERYLLIVNEQHDMFQLQAEAVNSNATASFDFVFRQKFTWPNIKF